MLHFRRALAAPALALIATAAHAQNIGGSLTIRVATTPNAGQFVAFPPSFQAVVI